MLIDGMLRRHVRIGELTVVDAGGRRHTYRGQPGYRCTVRLADRKLEREIFLAPDPSVGEAYMDGRLVIEEGDLFDFVMLVAQNMGLGGAGAPARAKAWLNRLLRRLYQLNTPARSRRNVARHYDLSGDFYALFLDRERQYSCAYFRTGEEGLDEAQRAKELHLAAKLLLRPGLRVLDIGCGWGALAIRLARDHGVDVTGVTLSVGQWTWANERARALGLADRVRFLLKDYREIGGKFDRIVSVGAFEHIGLGHYPAFFRKVEELLEPDGVALLHSIGRMAGPDYTSPFIREHIFPGGYIPALSEVLPVIERQGLWVGDIEILRLHYAQTLRLWRERLHASRQEVVAIYGERFFRMWEFYLVGSEVFFREQDGMNFQIQLARRRDAIPLTRDYLQAWEREHAPAQGRLRGTLAAAE